MVEKCDIYPLRLFTLLILCHTKHLLIAQAAWEAQRKGKPGQLVDPRPETVDGEIKIRITPQLVHDIFDEYPVVAKAYSENVPKKVWHNHPFVFHFQRVLNNRNEVIGRGILEALFPVQALQRSSCFYPFLRCSTCREGRSDSR